MFTSRDFVSRKNSPRAAGTAEGMTDTEVRTVPAIDNLVDLAEVREREDGGCRLALVEAQESARRAEEIRAIHRPDVPSMLFDGLGSDPEPEIDQEVLERVAATVAEFRTDAARELRHLDKHAPRHVHVEALAIIVQLDDFLLTLGEYVGEGS